MNILLINHYAGSPYHGMEYRPYYLAREWTRMGHQVTVVAATFSHLRSSNPESLRSPLREEVIDGIRYWWIRTSPYVGNGLGRVRNMLEFCWGLARCAKRAADAVKPGLVIASSTYPLDIFSAHAIARSRGARLIFEVHDLWPLSPMELGGLPAWHPYIAVMQVAENFAYRKCDRVVSLLPCAEGHMRKHGLAPGKFAHVPNGLVPEEWEAAHSALPSLHQAALERLRDDGLFIVGYAGAHGIANALDTLIDAAELMRDQPVAVVLVGQGPEKQRLQQEVRERSLANVVFLDSVPKPAVPALLSWMDALYIGFRKMPLYRFGVNPNKLMDYMMAGKPVIQSLEAANDMVADAGCGISVAAGDAHAVAEAVMRIMAMDENQRAAMGARGWEYVLRHHDYRVLAKKFLEAVMDGELC
ncbi:MAG: glycosyltransferase family 4 protein [Syntrophomonadaceae bacterium]|jgi:glycosyltransferase involved in cell wall biosynthesis|nr:glycosyltransferase family 4 protein [Syntrophomonadaceae bacterium]MDH7497695.1 glycosyltransferase family 4 protein [Syntrophomonadaceae bacterium]